MFVLMRCLHRPGQDAARDTHRPAHRAWVGSGGEGRVSVLIGSALLGPDGASVGNFGVLEAPDLATARAFAEGDPFHKAGIVAQIDLTPLPDTFQADRIANPMSPRL
ncbi:YciI family protein [Halodurantibacterium flavum]|uniref:YciI family protein n=1 Tax=Halodurantibacterium flavum TaxID=1382802 RepID=A0ABW4S6E4_9RHOB